MLAQKAVCRRFVIFLGHSILFSFLCHLRFPFKFTASGFAIQSNVCFAVAILFNSIFKETYHKKTNFSYCVLVLVSRLMKTNVMFGLFNNCKFRWNVSVIQQTFNNNIWIFFQNFAGWKLSAKETTKMLCVQTNIVKHKMKVFSHFRILYANLIGRK